MRLQVFDLANRTGIATGLAGQKPASIVAAVVKQRGSTQDPRETAYRFTRFVLDELWAFGAPQIVGVEDFMNPAASESDKATIAALLMHGALVACCAKIGIARPTPIHMATARVHFCGRASAHTRRDGPRTKAQKQQDRYDTNMMVWKRAVLLGYFPRDAQPDFDKGAAACLYDYASASLCGRRASEFRLFEG